MNAYGVFAILITLLALGVIFDLGPSFKQVAERLADIPEFSSKGSSPHLFDLAVRFGYLIAIVGVVRLFLLRK